MEHSKCKGCGKKIIWAKTSAGKKIPLDAVAPVYHYETAEYGDSAIKAENMYVSHFSTCKYADRFSSSKKEPLDRQRDEQEFEPFTEDDIPK